MADKWMSRLSGFIGDTSMSPTVTNSDSKRLISNRFSSSLVPNDKKSRVTEGSDHDKPVVSTTTNNMRPVIAKTHLKATHDHVKKAVAAVPANHKIKVDDKYKLKAEATRTLKGYDYKMKNALEDPACEPLKEEIKKAIEYLELSLKSIQNGGADVSYTKKHLLKDYTERYYDPLFKKINQCKQRSARINKNKQQK